MKALRLTRWGKPAELCEAAVPESGPGQVLLKIAGAGACHSDLHLMDWPEGPWKARAGKIRVDVEPFSLEKAPEVYERLRRGEIRGRAVIVPGK
jgi:D-arabinose 1-dehydrogenase-like Zn-dependent alcohol dehydrogenase